MWAKYSVKSIFLPSPSRLEPVKGKIDRKMWIFSSPILINQKKSIFTNFEYYIFGQGNYVQLVDPQIWKTIPASQLSGHVHIALNYKATRVTSILRLFHNYEKADKTCKSWQNMKKVTKHEKDDKTKKGHNYEMLV